MDTQQSQPVEKQKKLYEYAALDKLGNRVKGKTNAYTKDEVVQEINAKGLTIISIDEVSRFFSLDKLSEINIGGVPLKEKLLFMKQLSIMINAGLSITRALEVLSYQAQNPRFRQVIKEIYRLVSGGVSLSDAMAKFPDSFDTVTISLVRAGEQSGNLDRIFRKLSREYEQKQALSSKVLSALAYPAVLTLLMVGVVIFLMVAVVPQMQTAFAGFNAELPFITQVVISISYFMSNYWYILIILIASIVIGFRYYISTSGGKRVWHKFLIRVPLFGPLNSKIQTSNFARILYLLISSGVPILQALELTEASMTNLWFKEEVIEIREQVKRGIPLATPLLQSNYFPIILGYMVNVGQETGKIDIVLKKIAKYYDIEIRAVTTSLSSILEPILLIVMGLVVGLIVVSIYLPIFELTQQIK